MLKKVWVLMDRPPGPDSQFVEVEDAGGQALRVEWREEGRYWALGPFYIADDVDSEMAGTRHAVEKAVTDLGEAVGTIGWGER